MWVQRIFPSFEKFWIGSLSKMLTSCCLSISDWKRTIERRNNDSFQSNRSVKCFLHSDFLSEDLNMWRDIRNESRWEVDKQTIDNWHFGVKSENHFSYAIWFSWWNNAIDIQSLRKNVTYFLHFVLFVFWTNRLIRLLINQNDFLVKIEFANLEHFTCIRKEKKMCWRWQIVNSSSMWILLHILL